MNKRGVLLGIVLVIIGVLVVGGSVTYLVINKDKSKEAIKIVPIDKEEYQNPIITAQPQEQRQQQSVRMERQSSSEYGISPIEIMGTTPIEVNYNETEQIKVDWYQLRYGGFEQEYIIAIQNLANNPRNLDLSFFIDNSNVINYQVKIFEYDEFIKRHRIHLPNYVCSEYYEEREGNQTHGRVNITRQNCVDNGNDLVIDEPYREFKVQRQRLGRNGNRERFVLFDIPRLNSNRDRNSFNGTKYYKITFEIPINSYGRFGLINEQTGTLYHPFFNTTYTYRQPVNYTNVFAPVTNFTVLLLNGTFNTNNLIINGKLQTDCDDIIFTNMSDNFQIPYLFESKNDVAFGCNSPNSIVWLKNLDTVPLTNSTPYGHYIYYGNPTALDQQQRYSVFNDLQLAYIFGNNNSIIEEDMSGRNRNGTIQSEGGSLTSRLPNKTIIGYGLLLNHSDFLGGIPYVNISSNWTVSYQVVQYDDSATSGMYHYNRFETPTANKNGVLFGQSTTDRFMYIRFTNDTQDCTNNALAADYTSTNTIGIGVPTTVTWRHNGTRIGLYLNGVFVWQVPAQITGICSGNNVGHHGAFGISSWTNTSNSFFGNLDNLLIWNRSLSEPEINALHYQSFKFPSFNQTFGTEEANFTNLTITSITFTPSSASPIQDLNLSFTATDTSNRQVNATIRFYRNNTLISDIYNITTNYPTQNFTSFILDDGNTTIYETWKGEVQLWNLNEYGSRVNSSTITIGNALPTIPNIISPANNTNIIGGVLLTCSNSSDSDGDTIKYEIYGDTSTSPTTLLQNTTSQGFSWTPLTNARNYWKCQAIDTRGGASGFNITRQINNGNFVRLNSTVPNYINFTFVDETNGTVIRGTVNSFTSYSSINSTFNYNRSLTFTSSTLETNYSFGLIPFNDTIFTSFAAAFGGGTLYQQRNYNKVKQLSNVTTNEIIYLLATADGIFVTFQVINTAEQPLSGVNVSAGRTISGIFTNLESGSTGDDGGVTFFLNPNFAHTITAQKAGYNTATVSITPTQSIYTITLSSSNATVTTNYYEGINAVILPTISTILLNDTSYNFNITINSTFWDLQSAGFVLTNGSTTIGSASCTGTSTGCYGSTTINTANFTQIIMNYYWQVNNSFVNSSVFWSVTEYDIVGEPILTLFKRDFQSFSRGFGTGANAEFTKALIAFMIIFLVVGSITYYSGVYSTAAILGEIFFLSFLLTIIGLIPKVTPTATPYFIPIIIGIVWVIDLIYEYVVR